MIEEFPPHLFHFNEIIETEDKTNNFLSSMIDETEENDKKRIENSKLFLEFLDYQLYLISSKNYKVKYYSKFIKISSNSSSTSSLLSSSTSSLFSLAKNEIIQEEFTTVNIKDAENERDIRQDLKTIRTSLKISSSSTSLLSSTKSTLEEEEKIKGQDKEDNEEKEEEELSPLKLIKINNVVKIFSFFFLKNSIFIDSTLQFLFKLLHHTRSYDSVATAFSFPISSSSTLSSSSTTTSTTTSSTSKSLLNKKSYIIFSSIKLLLIFLLNLINNNLKLILILSGSLLTQLIFHPSHLLSSLLNEDIHLNFLIILIKKFKILKNLKEKNNFFNFLLYNNIKNSIKNEKKNLISYQNQFSSSNSISSTNIPSSPQPSSTTSISSSTLSTTSISTYSTSPSFSSPIPLLLSFNIEELEEDQDEDYYYSTSNYFQLKKQIKMLGENFFKPLISRNQQVTALEKLNYDTEEKKYDEFYQLFYQFSYNYKKINGRIDLIFSSKPRNEKDKEINMDNDSIIFFTTTFKNLIAKFLSQLPSSSYVWLSKLFLQMLLFYRLQILDTSTDEIMSQMGIRREGKEEGSKIKEDREDRMSKIDELKVSEKKLMNDFSTLKNESSQFPSMDSSTSTTSISKNNSQIKIVRLNPKPVNSPSSTQNNSRDLPPPPSKGMNFLSAVSHNNSKDLPPPPSKGMNFSSVVSQNNSRDLPPPPSKGMNFSSAVSQNNSRDLPPPPSKGMNFLSAVSQNNSRDLPPPPSKGMNFSSETSTSSSYTQNLPSTSQKNSRDLPPPHPSSNLLSTNVDPFHMISTSSSTSLPTSRINTRQSKTIKNNNSNISNLKVTPSATSSLTPTPSVSKPMVANGTNSTSTTSSNSKTSSNSTTSSTNNKNISTYLFDLAPSLCFEGILSFFSLFLVLANNHSLNHHVLTLSLHHIKKITDAVGVDDRVGGRKNRNDLNSSPSSIPTSSPSSTSHTPSTYNLLDSTEKEKSYHLLFDIDKVSFNVDKFTLVTVLLKQLGSVLSFLTFSPYLYKDLIEDEEEVTAIGEDYSEIEFNLALLPLRELLERSLNYSTLSLTVPWVIEFFKKSQEILQKKKNLLFSYSATFQFLSSLTYSLSYSLEQRMNLSGNYLYILSELQQLWKIYGYSKKQLEVIASSSSALQFSLFLPQYHILLREKMREIISLEDIQSIDSSDYAFSEVFIFYQQPNIRKFLYLGEEKIEEKNPDSPVNTQSSIIASTSSSGTVRMLTPKVIKKDSTPFAHSLLTPSEVSPKAKKKVTLSTQVSSPKATRISTYSESSSSNSTSTTSTTTTLSVTRSAKTPLRDINQNLGYHIYGIIDYSFPMKIRSPDNRIESTISSPPPSSSLMSSAERRRLSSNQPPDASFFQISPLLKSSPNLLVSPLSPNIPLITSSTSSPSLSNNFNLLTTLQSEFWRRHPALEPPSKLIIDTLSHAARAWNLEIVTSFVYKISKKLEKFYTKVINKLNQFLVTYNEIDYNLVKFLQDYLNIYHNFDNLHLFSISDVSISSFNTSLLDSSTSVASLSVLDPVKAFLKDLCELKFFTISLSSPKFLIFNKDLFLNDEKNIFLEIYQEGIEENEKKLRELVDNTIEKAGKFFELHPMSSAIINMAQFFTLIKLNNARSQFETIYKNLSYRKLSQAKELLNQNILNKIDNLLSSFVVKKKEKKEVENEENENKEIENKEVENKEEMKELIEVTDENFSLNIKKLNHMQSLFSIQYYQKNNFLFFPHSTYSTPKSCFISFNEKKICREYIDMLLNYNVFKFSPDFSSSTSNFTKYFGLKLSFLPQQEEGMTRKNLHSIILINFPIVTQTLSLLFKIFLNARLKNFSVEIPTNLLKKREEELEMYIKNYKEDQNNEKINKFLRNNFIEMLETSPIFSLSLFLQEFYLSLQRDLSFINKIKPKLTRKKIEISNLFNIIDTKSKNFPSTSNTSSSSPLVSSFKSEYLGRFNAELSIFFISFLPFILMLESLFIYNISQIENHYEFLINFINKENDVEIIGKIIKDSSFSPSSSSCSFPTLGSFSLSSLYQSTSLHMPSDIFFNLLENNLLTNNLLLNIFQDYLKEKNLCYYENFYYFYGIKSFSYASLYNILTRILKKKKEKYSTSTSSSSYSFSVFSHEHFTHEFSDKVLPLILCLTGEEEVEEEKET